MKVIVINFQTTFNAISHNIKTMSISYLAESGGVY